MSSTENLPKNGSTVLTETTPVTAPTIIRDVEELKANLKEEKRARAATAEVEESTATAQDQPLTPESERRKRRKVDGDDTTDGEVLDGPLKTTEKDIPTLDSQAPTDGKSAEKDKADPAQQTLPSETPKQDDKVSPSNCVAETVGAEKTAGAGTLSATEANDCSTTGACANPEDVTEQATPLESVEAVASKEEDKAAVEPIR
ncbi:uncharacterized protein MELLADRAFT_92283 [Melampsora larici-populina 98AG31]|uniref:Uncharacterized protein n=1 Tax=Melampsora larici-populina (strain 98AG31 / pathotype 3-4-7) TaxID=747676 RepID=F4R925_MELLP|nr:uncharacterized protein MELLADRAFT_92283 [Melampsora larici-populina 98AG31]EGG10913.1 hypothetical protein MELLADRAFT_92283 [Melampsora larici-populina 98AG31]